MREFSSHKKRIVSFLKEALAKSPLTDDFGDYIQYMAWYGEDGFCRQQIALGLETQTRDSLFFGKAYPALRFLGGSVVIPEVSTDMLMGLVEYYRLSKWKPARAAAERAVESLERRFIRNRHVSWMRFPALRLTVPFSRGLNGTFIELLVDLHELTGEGRYLRIAEDLAEGWLRMPFFRRHGLFPDFQAVRFGFLNRALSGRASLFKHNSAVVNGLLALYGATEEGRHRQAIEQWLAAAHKAFVNTDVYGQYDCRTKIRSRPELMYAFPLIDILCDASRALGDARLLDLAERLAQPWLRRRTKIGLIPNRPDGRETFIDAITDFSVSCFRLGELRDKKYTAAALALTEANLRRHACQPDRSFTFEGSPPCLLPAYADAVDARTGEMVKKQVTAKFVALLLKPVICAEEGRLYKNKALLKMMRDR